MMFGGSDPNVQKAASEKVKVDFGNFVICCALVEIGAFAASWFGAEWMDADPQTLRFMQQLQAETQRQKFTEQVHTLTNRCWDICFADYRPPSKMDGKTQTCLQNCVNRMIDASNFMVEHLQKMETGKGMI